MRKESGQWPTEMTFYMRTKCPRCVNTVYHSGDGITRCGGCNFDFLRCDCTDAHGGGAAPGEVVFLAKEPCGLCGDSEGSCSCDARGSVGESDAVVLYGKAKCPRCPYIVAMTGDDAGLCRGCGSKAIHCDCRPGLLRRVLKFVGLARRQES